MIGYKRRAIACFIEGPPFVCFGLIWSAWLPIFGTCTVVSGALVSVLGIIWYHRARILEKPREALYQRDSSMTPVDRKDEYGIERTPQGQDKSIEVQYAGDEPGAIQGGSGKTSAEAILQSMPGGKYVKISYLLKALNITDINDARHLEITLKSLANQGLVEMEKQEGKFYYKRRE